MGNKIYHLRYLQIFEQDLINTASYITNVLKNEDAALRLVDDVETATLERLNNPVAFEPYVSAKISIIYGCILLRRLNIDVFTCLNFHLPRWSTLCYGPCLTDVHRTSSTINRCSTRYNSFFRLADENLFCVKFINI